MARIKPGRQDWLRLGNQELGLRRSLVGDDVQLPQADPRFCRHPEVGCEELARMLLGAGLERVKAG